MRSASARRTSSPSSCSTSTSPARRPGFWPESASARSSNDPHHPAPGGSRQAREAVDGQVRRSGEARVLDRAHGQGHDGTLIRIPLPPLNEERRRELVKVVHKFAEEGRVAIRHARTDAISKVKKTEHVSEDEKKHTEKDIQKLHDDHLRQVDEAVKAKEAEIIEV